MNAYANATAGMFRVLWNIIRAPILVVLMLLEPIVGFICMAVMILGAFAAVMFEISAVGPRFPFLGMMAASLGFGVFYLVYSSIIALLLE